MNFCEPELIFKYAFSFFKTASLKTITITPNSPEFSKYRDQIQQLLHDRYAKDLGYEREFDFSNLPIGSLILTVDDNDQVIGLSGIDERFDQNRVRMFALKEPPKGSLEVKKNQAAAFSQIETTFSQPNTFTEISEDLFEKFKRFYSFYEKINKSKPFPLYFYPASSAAVLIPFRKIYVSTDGVRYQKKVHLAQTIATKVLIGNSEMIKGQQGYTSYEEASQNAKYKDQLISGGPDGLIKVYDFNAQLWK